MQDKILVEFHSVAVLGKQIKEKQPAGYQANGSVEILTT